MHKKKNEGTNQVEGAGEPALDLHELVLAVRGIAAEGEDVLDPIGLDGGEGVVDLLDGHVGAGEVHHGLDADHVLHPVRDVQGEVGGGPAGAPGDVAEGRVVDDHPVHPLEKVVHAVLRLGREELEREHHLPLAAAAATAVAHAGRLPDLLNHLHCCAPSNERDLVGRRGG